MDARPGNSDWVGWGNAFRQAVAEGRLERYHQRRWQRAVSFNQWLQPDNLAALSPEQALALYRASGGNRVADFKSNPVEEIRDSLDFLLYDTITLEARFAECASAEGSYKLVGAGKEFLSYLLCLHRPELFAVWNQTSERALRRLGLYQATISKGHLGLGYLDLLGAMENLRRRAGLPHFQEVDEFCHLVCQWR